MPREIKNNNIESLSNTRYPSLSIAKPSTNRRRHRSIDDKPNQSNTDVQSINIIHKNIRSRNNDTNHTNNFNPISSVIPNGQHQNESKQILLQDATKSRISDNNDNKTNQYQNSSLKTFKNKSINDVFKQQSQNEYYSRKISEIHNRPSSIIDIDQHKVLHNAWSDRSISKDHYRRYVKEELQHNRHRRRRKYCCGCSWPCVLLSLLAIFCLGTVIAAILVALLTTKKISTTTIISITVTTETTTTITSTSSSLSTSTTTSSTSVSTTSTTSVTSSTTSTTSTTVSTTTLSTSTSTTATTSTSGSPVTTATTTTSSTTTTTATTTTTTTTTTLPVCNSVCGNDASIVSSRILAQWKFENTFVDSMLVHNATPINAPTFVLGYVGQALSLNSASNQYLSTSFIPVNSTSFTIDAWIYPTSFSNTKGIHSIAGLCPQQVAQECLQFGLRSNVTSVSSTGYFGLWESANLRGALPLLLNEWTHVAIVYGKSKLRQYIYVNGIFDNSRASSYGFNGTSGTFYIGNNYDLTTNPSFGTNNFQGYIDQLTVLQGIRTACEVLNVATMASRCSFDNTSDFLADSGPNDVSVNAYNYVSINGLKGGQAISFTSSSSSYLQASGYRFLSYNDSPFSLSLWVQPTLHQGTLVGSSLSYEPLTFASNGSLIARVGSTSISFSFLLQLTPIWSHIVLTCSSSNGLRLYVNNQLVATGSVSTLTGSGTSSNYFTLGSGSFTGTIDEWRVYSRELSVDDVCAIFTN